MAARRRSHRLVGGLVVAVAIGLLVAAVADDVHVQRELHRSQTEATTTKTLVRRTSALLSSTTRTLSQTDEDSVAAQANVTRVTAQIASTQKELAQARAGVATGEVELGDVHTCASGVSRSVAALQGGQQKAAVSALSSVRTACQDMLGSAAGGTVYPYDFADPSVIDVRGTYFAYGTNSTAGNIQIMESTDLLNWKKAGDALPTLASWATPDATWAPAVIHLKNSYLLYYTAAVSGSRVQCLSVATAKRPQGPFTDSSKTPLECQASLGGSIDPSPYLDAKGHPYLTWKSNGGGGQSSTIWAQALDNQGTALKGAGPTVLLRPSQSWEASVVEAPSMVAVDGGYDLFYSANNWDTSHYAVGVARCTGVLGPCTKPLSGPLYSSQSNLEGPGGASVFTDGQGNLQMAFQAWLPGSVGYPHPRLLFIRQLNMVDGIPRVDPPG
jgi:beta-xylosidase